jgi:hypothetical protein
MSGKGGNKPRRRASSRMVKASTLKDEEQVHALSQGTLKNYRSMLAQADEWLPQQLEALLREQTQLHEEQQAEITDPALVPSGSERIPENGSAKNAFTNPMECTPYLISLFAYSKCVLSNASDTVSDTLPSGVSVLKTIHAAFIQRFEQV